MRKLTIICSLFLSSVVFAQKSKTPIMGWSSWNNFRINISEQLIRQQADYMISSGLYDAGYRFINVDDGYFKGRNDKGGLLHDTIKFPSGMRNLSDYIHRKGLKSGIYSDAGANTCGSIWDNDKNGVGVGLYRHHREDLRLFFKEWGYDFIKVDWCGGQQMKLNEKEEYLKIISEVRSLNANAVFNICRWTFPGEWAIKASDSWRISADIEPSFESICKIIDLNAPLAKYASPGHFNDMDMLQVGRGMTYDEDKSHFSMWCMLGSPLLAGNDLRNMTKETISILTNKGLIALNQDPLGLQAERTLVKDGVEVWVKPLSRKRKAVAFFNRSGDSTSFSLEKSNISLSNGATVRDLWLDKDLGKPRKDLEFSLPAHGIVVLQISEK